MITIDNALIEGVYPGPTQVPTIRDIGATFFDVPKDQPPFIGLIFELDWPGSPVTPWRQLYRLNVELTVELVELLAAHLLNVEPRSST